MIEAAALLLEASVPVRPGLEEEPRAFLRPVNEGIGAFRFIRRVELVLRNKNGGNSIGFHVQTPTHFRWFAGTEGMSLMGGRLRTRGSMKFSSASLIPTPSLAKPRIFPSAAANPACRATYR